MRRELPRLLTVREVREATGLPASSIYDAIYAKELPCYHFGRAVKLDQEDVRLWIERNRQEDRSA